MELKKYLQWIALILGIFALIFSIYVNMLVIKKQVSFMEDYNQFKEEWISGAYDLKIIKSEPQISENYYDSCNEREINEVLESLNSSMSDILLEIEGLHDKVYPDKINPDELPEGVTLSKG